MGNGNWTFFKAFLKSPRVVGSVIPSSTSLEQRVVAAADVATARLVVELGAGMGGITRALLAAMEAEAKLLAIERTPEFAENLRRIDDDRLEVVHGCASSVVKEMNSRGLPLADAVVSGIPFSTIPEGLSREIISAIQEALAPGGRFVAYQISSRVADYAQPLLGVPSVAHELRNVPPLRVFTWHKESAPEHGCNSQRTSGQPFV